MYFLNCSSPFPTTNGLHISASSCGSGKTTIISEIAKTHALEGVLIVVPTIEAAEELSMKLPIAYVLHSRNITSMEAYRKKPQGLHHNILVITSARLIIDPIELFLDYGFGKKRKYVLIDELINFYPEPYSIPQSLSDTLTYIDHTKTHKTGHLVGSLDVDGKTYYRHTYGTLGELKAAYQVGQHRLFKGKSNALAEYKTNHILQHVLANGLSPIQQKVIDIAQDHVVFLFDGTADIVFKGDKRLLPLSGSRYKSDIEFMRFPMPIKRKNKMEPFWIRDFYKYAPDLMKIIADITKNEKLLVVTWKTLDVFKNDLDADKLENHKVSIDGFPERLKEILVKNGAVESNLKVIYRGSGQDRGSNEYRDFESIMFLGEWNLPDNITGDINSMFGCKCEFQDYKKSLVVQTICRLQIRKHLGLPIKVYFSEDIDYNLMYEVQEYFKANSDSGCKIIGLTNPCPKYTKPEKGYMIDLAFLEAYDANIRNAIENQMPYSFSITLDDLYSIIPKDKKGKDRYTRLIKYLQNELQITMKIK